MGGWRLAGGSVGQVVCAFLLQLVSGPGGKSEEQKDALEVASYLSGRDQPNVSPTQATPRDNGGNPEKEKKLKNLRKARETF